MPIELNGAGEEIIAPIREALKAAQKARAVLFPASEDPPASSEIPSLEGAAGKMLVVNGTEDGLEFDDVPSGGGGGAESFTDLDDVPAAYTGQAGKMLVVNGTEDGLEFDDVPSGGGGGAESFTDLDDVPADYTGQAGKMLVVNGTEDGLEFDDVPSGGGGGLTNFTEALNSSSPNGTVTVASLTATDAATNVDLVLSPKGTGAILANVPDATSTGGSKRGTSAVDLCLSRSSSSLVASGNYSVLVGGASNQASGSYSAIVGGNINVASGSYAFVGGGGSNAARTNYSVVGGGESNSADTSTHASVLGGQSNNAKAQWSTVGGGQSNMTQYGSHTTIGGGQGNSATGQWGTVGGGQSNSAIGTHAAVPGGLGSQASETGSFAHGMYANADRLGQWAFASGRFSQIGDAQASLFLLRRSSSDATPVVLTSNGNSPGTANVIYMSANTVVKFRAIVAARATASSVVKTWDVSGTIKQGANAASTALVGTPSVVSTDADAGASAWTLAVSADTSTGFLVFTATGVAATSIRWVARVETVELK